MRRRRLSSSSTNSTLAGNPLTTGNAVATTADVDQRVDEPVYLGLKLSTWVQIGIIAALFVGVFWPNLRRLWLKTRPIYGEPNSAHAMFVPIIALYYIYVNRDELLSERIRAAWTGLPIAIFGMAVYAYGIWPGQNDLWKDIGMVIALFGLVFLLTGWAAMRILWFPLVFLFCAIPWPGLLYSWIASPLQRLAAKAAVFVLRITGVESNQSGTKIDMMTANGDWRTLNVAEACAGLRSLMTFITVAAAIAFLSVRPLWQKIIITLSAIPIAIFCNTMRVSGQGLLDRYVSRGWSEGFAHQFAGLAMLVPAFFMILLVGWILDQLFIEVADDAPKKPAQPMAFPKHSKPASMQKGDA